MIFGHFFARICTRRGGELSSNSSKSATSGVGLFLFRACRSGSIDFSADKTTKCKIAEETRSQGPTRRNPATDSIAVGAVYLLLPACLFHDDPRIIFISARMNIKILLN